MESFVRSMGADDVRLFRLYNILSTRADVIMGPPVGVVGAGGGGPVEAAAAPPTSVTEAAVSAAFRTIFRL